MLSFFFMPICIFLNEVSLSFATFIKKMIVAILKKHMFLLTSLIVMSQVHAQSPHDARGYILEVGDQVPNLELKMIDSTTLSLYDLKGKVVVLQFTASWCSVCRTEMPHLETEVWLPNKDDEFVLIGIDIDKDANKVIPFIESMHITYPVAYDADKSHFYNFASEQAGVTRNIVIDQEMNIVFQTRLFDPVEFDEMKKVISALLH